MNKKTFLLGFLTNSLTLYSGCSLKILNFIPETKIQSPLIAESKSFDQRNIKGSNIPILLSEMIVEYKFFRSIAKHLLLRGLASLILAHYSKVISFASIYLSNSNTLAAISQLVYGDFNDPDFTMSTFGAVESRVASPSQSPTRGVSSRDLHGAGRFPGVPVPAYDEPPTTRNASAIRERKSFTKSAPQMGFSHPAIETPAFSNLPPAEQQSILMGFAKEAQNNTSCACQNLNDSLLVNSHNKIFTLAANVSLPLVALCMIILSNKLEPWLDERIGRNLINAINKGAIIKVPENEFTKLVFESFAIGGYMFDSARIIQSVKTLRAACLAINKRSEELKVPVQYTYWCNGIFLTNI